MNIRAAIYTFLVFIGLPVTTFIFPTVMIGTLMGISLGYLVYMTYDMFKMGEED